MGQIFRNILKFRGLYLFFIFVLNYERQEAQRKKCPKRSKVYKMKFFFEFLNCRDPTLSNQ